MGVEMLDNSNMQTLNQYISKSKARRTQQEWADEFGISRSYLSEILSGAVSPGWKTILKIHEATGGKVPPGAWVNKEKVA